MANDRSNIPSIHRRKELIDPVIINSFDDVIDTVKKAIDDVKIEQISEPSFCTILNTYLNKINELKQQICGATPKGPI